MRVNIKSTADGQINWDMLSRKERQREQKNAKKGCQIKYNILSFSNFQHYPPAPAIPWHSGLKKTNLGYIECKIPVWQHWFR